MSQITIEELDGQKRMLILRGGGLPTQGAEWGGEQVVDTVWIPGSPAAVQHVMGPTEMPSDWEGEWNSTRLVSLPVLWDPGGGEVELILADDVRDAFDSLRSSGQLLHVTWAAKDNRRVDRYGRLTKSNFPTTRADDIKWKATFTWIGTVRATVAVVQSDQGAAAARAAALAAADAQSAIDSATFIQSNPKVPFSATQFTLGNLEQLANEPKLLAQSFSRAMVDLTSRLATVGQIVQTVIGAPAEVTQQFIDATLDAVDTAKDFVDQVSRVPLELFTTRTSVKSLLMSGNYYDTAQASAEVMAAQAMTAARQAQARQSARVRSGADPRALAGIGDVQAVYLPKIGDTMTSIALKFYSQDLSYQLSRANGLPGSTIDPPRYAIIIPVRSVIDAVGQQP